MLSKIWKERCGTANMVQALWKTVWRFLKKLGIKPSSVSSVAQSCPTLCDLMNRSMPGLPVHHQLPEFTQTHVHWVCDAIQPSHPLSSPSPPDPNPSQHQSLFQWVNSAWGGQSTGVSALASFLPKNTQRNANQNYNEISPHTSQHGYHQRNPQTINAEAGVEEREPSYTVGGNAN